MAPGMGLVLFITLASQAYHLRRPSLEIRQDTRSLVAAIQLEPEA